MKRLSREHHIYVLDPEGLPAITVESGEELMVETWDAFEGVRDAAVLEAKIAQGAGHRPDLRPTGPPQETPFESIFSASLRSRRRGPPTWSWGTGGSCRRSSTRANPTVMTFESGQVVHTRWGEAAPGPLDGVRSDDANLPPETPPAIAGPTAETWT